ncbi:MAG: dephospho-CoA kinase [Bryobacterales bacterium]|nr:dephospho-CoA kinase [Bryobacteraceae bacterium]MDW8353981.1 dephospho-CoA kinase [Bryobacterales bacterium]
MLKVGLTGGLATGKSFVGAALRDLGCYLIQADALGHEVLEPGGEAYAEVVREFGKEILRQDETIDRRRLAGIVFADPEKLAVLNRLVHPPVLRRLERAEAEIAARDPRAIVVVEAAVLIEAGVHDRFDKLIVVVCDEAQQIARAVARGDGTREEVLSRIRQQLPLEEKRKFADYVIDTSGSKEETLRQVRAVYDRLRSLTS